MASISRSNSSFSTLSVGIADDVILSLEAAKRRGAASKVISLTVLALSAHTMSSHYVLTLCPRPALISVCIGYMRDPDSVKEPKLEEPKLKEPKVKKSLLCLLARSFTAREGEL